MERISKSRVKHLIVPIMIFFSILLLDQGNVHANSESNIVDITLPNNSEEISPQSTERVRWYYRTVNGRQQRRLWSLTSGRWLTNWQWV